MISGYEITEKIAESGKSMVYRCRRESDGQAVVLKVLRHVFPSLSDIARFRKEYDLVKSISMDGVIRSYGFIEDNNRIALVLEDFKGISLKKHIMAGKIGIEEFLQIAIRISGTLGAIHEKNIIHKDIKPHNILYNPETGSVKITDFGMSILLTRDLENFYDPYVISGTLPYMSPEQTGRINRSIDYRTDFYSLGITFYEMLTGDVPFKTHDPLEIIYSHIAREPESPRARRDGLPETLSDIVMKLLAKNAESRYRNGYGLKADLEECLARWNSHHKIPPFPLGRTDVSGRFSLPQMIVGRDQERAALNDAYIRVCQGGCEMLIVTGAAGVGKSALVHEMEKTVNEKRGYFIFSGYDMLKRNVPFSAIIHALQKLTLRILAEGSDRAAQWRDDIVSSLGNNCRIIMDVIPELALLVDRQPDSPEIDPEKSQHRFTRAFTDFIRIFSRREHPLVIFLDDMQWADSASMAFLAKLMTDYKNEYLLIIGSYRDGDNPLAEIMTGTLSDMKEKVKQLPVEPLSSDNVAEYLSILLAGRKGDLLLLADLVHKKTNGNPFFLMNFLKNLHETGSIRYNQPGGWLFDLEAIQGMQVSDNVAALMVDRINRLAPETREALKLAACIGNRFDLETISYLCERDMGAMLTDIQGALDDGLIHYAAGQYRFLHDRIQEMLYSLIPAEQRRVLHRRIGLNLLDHTPEGELGDKIFYIVRHLNAGTAAGDEHSSIVRLARLNLMAGVKAKSSTAYVSAIEYLATGIGLLDERDWTGEYRVMYNLHFEMAECEYLNGDFEAAFSLFDLIMKHSEHRIDRARVLDKKVIIYINQGLHETAIENGLAALEIMGVAIPSRPGTLHIARELLRSRFLMGRRTVGDLLDAPEVTDPEKIMIMTLCMNTGTASYFVNQELVAFLAMKIVNMSLKYGNTKISSFAYLSYGLIIGYRFGKYESACEFGELAMSLNEKFNNIDLKPRILFIFGFLISHWRHQYDRTIDLLGRSYRLGVETGDINYAVYSVINLVQYRIKIGDNLDQVFQDLAGQRDFVYRTRNEEFIYEYIINQRFILSHKGRTRSLADYSDNEFSEDDFVEKIKKYPVSMCSYSVYKIVSLYHAGDPGAARIFAERIEKQIDTELYSQTNVALFNNGYSLVLAALCRSSGPADRRRFLKKIKKNQKKFKAWADNCPGNYLHKYLLVEAELAAVTGNASRAAALYEEAIHESEKNNFNYYKALANELCGRFYAGRGRDFIARAYLAEASYCYVKCGYTAVSHKLSEDYPQFLSGNYHPSDTGADIEQSSSSSTRLLDFTTLLKTTQIISGEIVLDKLLRKLVQVIGECAAATRAALIMERDGMLVIEASGDLSINDITVLQGTPIDSSTEISAAVVHYVARTKDTLVLNDASNVGIFVSDPYIRENRCKSILCIPIVHQGKLSGIFYAENNLTTQAFTDDRINLLKTLASYVAISVDNARLYANMEDKVKERTYALEYAYEQVTEAYNIIQEDISLARRIQENILPGTSWRSARFDIDIHFYPMTDVGGDIYDIHEFEPGRIRIFLADATGHGVQAAMVTMLIKSEYEKLKPAGLAPAALMEQLNNQFIKSYRNLAVLFSCVIADVDLEQNIVRYASAGHPDQYLVSGDELHVLTRTGKIIGFISDIRYSTGECAFHRGDKLLLFSDGIYEEFDADLKEYGERRLKEVIRASGKEPVETITKNIIRDVRVFTGKEQINSYDDVTIVGVEVKA